MDVLEAVFADCAVRVLCADDEGCACAGSGLVHQRTSQAHLRDAICSIIPCHDEGSVHHA